MAKIWFSESNAHGISAALIEGMLKADCRSVEPFLTSAFDDTVKNWPRNKDA